jgi:PTH1 family peptidyl-tRNA hydrolase
LFYVSKHIAALWNSPSDESSASIHHGRNSMKVVVGLGNPGSKYQNARHNVGFQVVGELALRHGVSKPRVKFEAEIAEVTLDGEKLLLADPQTYMNESGRSVAKLVDFYKLSVDQLMIVCDDMNLPTGQLRMRKTGSAGGQKGLMNILQALGAEQIPRLRIGIGRPPGRMDATDYVLGRFRKQEIEVINHAVMLAADGIELWAKSGIDAAMNQINASSSE